MQFNSTDPFVKLQHILKQYLAIYTKIKENDSIVVRIYDFIRRDTPNRLASARVLADEIIRINKLDVAIDFCIVLGETAHNLKQKSVDYPRYGKCLHAMRSYLISKISQSEDGQKLLHAKRKSVKAIYKREEDRKAASLKDLSEQKTSIQDISANYSDSLNILRRKLIYLEDPACLAQERAFFESAFPREKTSEYSICYEYDTDIYDEHQPNMPRVVRSQYYNQYLRLEYKEEYSEIADPIIFFEKKFLVEIFNLDNESKSTSENQTSTKPETPTSTGKIAQTIPIGKPNNYNTPKPLQPANHAAPTITPVTANSEPKDPSPTPDVTESKTSLKR